MGVHWQAGQPRNLHLAAGCKLRTREVLGNQHALRSATEWADTVLRIVHEDRQHPHARQRPGKQGADAHGEQQVHHTRGARKDGNNTCRAMDRPKYLIVRHHLPGDGATAHVRVGERAVGMHQVLKRHESLRSPVQQGAIRRHIEVRLCEVAGGPDVRGGQVQCLAVPHQPKAALGRLAEEAHAPAARRRQGQRRTERRALEFADELHPAVVLHGLYQRLLLCKGG
mmetsp:Transcript_7194/g.21986  ORF Transcript_7194/g.21986 Transcript_7194/m.21986 type:complete len:226 (+) Transcript_7194:1096-1773(+)